MTSMYLVSVIATTVILPLLATIIELVASPGADPLLVAGRWFVFFGVGIRLLLAGLSQIVRPGFTAKNLLGIETDDANQVVQELGFANTAMGIAGLVAYFFAASWLPAVAAIAGIFLLLAGLRHLVKKGKSAMEWIPTITDLILAVVLLAFAVVSVLA